MLLILGLFTSVIIARILGPEGKGIYSLAIFLSSFLIIFSQFGIGPASVFYIGKREYPLKEIFGTNLIFSTLISIIAINAGLIIILFFSEKIFPGIEQEYLFLALFLVPLQLFLTFVNNILLGLQKIKKYNLIQLVHVSIFLILVIIFLLGLHLNVKAVIIAEVLSLFIACIVLFLLIKREIGGIVLRVRRKLLKDFFSYSSKVYLGSVLFFLQCKIGIFLVNIFLNPIAVGFYSVAIGVAEKVWLISQAAGIILFPKISSETNNKNLNNFTPLVCRNILFITFIFAVILFIISHWLIILLYSKEFSDAVFPFQIMLIGAVMIGGWRILAYDLYGRGKPILNSYITGISVVVNIILNIILVPKFNIVGAAWAITASHITAFILIVVIYSRISNNNIGDIVFVKKSDFRFYKNFLFLFTDKYLNIKSKIKRENI